MFYDWTKKHEILHEKFGFDIEIRKFRADSVKATQYPSEYPNSARSYAFEWTLHRKRRPVTIGSDFNVRAFVSTAHRCFVVCFRCHGTASSLHVQHHRALRKRVYRRLLKTDRECERHAKFRSRWCDLEWCDRTWITPLNWISRPLVRTGSSSITTVRAERTADIKLTNYHKIPKLTKCKLISSVWIN